MAVDYDLACRRDSLGSLLAAAFLARAGGRVLLLPPENRVRPEPGFLVPVVRGYPAALLAGLFASGVAESPPERILSWRLGSRLAEFSLPAGAAGEEFEKLWRLIDGCMARQLEMPVASLGGSGRMLWLLVKNELLRENRSRLLGGWLAAAGIDGNARKLWPRLVPPLTLSRFADPPLLALAYGAAVLARPEGWFPPVVLKRGLLELLRSYGAEFSEEAEWKPVFDGKWYIGVGTHRQAARRSTVYLADADPENLLREVDAADRRLDFKRQMELAEPGFVVYEERVAPGLPAGVASFHLEGGGDRDFGDLFIYAPASGGEDGRIAYRFRPAGGSAHQSPEEAADYRERERTWGWTPRLPAMMGGGFLPLSKGFCRFYQVGWHNLPGFGLGGLVYAARQAAVRVWSDDLRRDPADLESRSGD